MSESDTDQDWRELAEQLRERGGVPERRAEAVALVAEGRTYEEAAGELGIESDSARSQIGQHVRRFREQDVAEAEWLAEHAPDV